MTPIVKVVAALMVLGLAAQAHGQQQERDTTHALRIELREPGLDSGGAVFFIPPHLAIRPAFSSATLFFEGVPTAGGPGSGGRGFEVKQDLLAPLRAQWAREAETKTFRTIMGSIQLGGVAFLAVRQLTGAGIMTAKPRPVRPQRK